MPPEFDSLAQALQSHAQERPNVVAARFLTDIDSDGVSCTYQELDSRARQIATRLRALNCGGRNALLIHPPGLEFIAALFGCFYAGVTAVPTYPIRFRADARADARSLALIEDAKPVAILTTEAGSARARKLAHRAGNLNPTEWLATDGPGFRTHPESPLPHVDPDSIAMLQYTSGSTRVPRGVMLTHRNLMDNERVIADHMQHSLESRMVSWLPPYHDMGLIGGILQPLTLGFPLTLMDPAYVLQKPVRWLRAISRARATTSGAPNSFFELCVQTIHPEERNDLDLSSWRVAFNGSEPIRADTLQRFTDYFAPCGFQPNAFFPCYGLAESTLLMTGRGGFRMKTLDRRSLEQSMVRLHDEGVSITTCGRPGTGFQVVIVNPETVTECEQDRIGEIWTSGASVARGYWNWPVESEHTFGNALPGRAGRFLRTGDLGFISDEELFVTGRIKDLIIIRGRNFYPHDIEAAAGSVHGAVSPDACVAFGVDGAAGEDLVIVCEVRREERHRADFRELHRLIREAVAEECDIGVSSIVLVKPAALPRTTSGKLRRNACKQAYLAGELAVMAEPSNTSPQSPSPDNSTNVRVRRELAAVLNVTEYSFDAEKPLARQGIDSLARVELLLRLETEFGVQLDPKLINLEITLKDLVEEIDRRLVAHEDTAAISLPVDTNSYLRVSLTPSQLQFFTECERGESKYAMVIALRTPADVDVPALSSAVLSLQRHDAFRLRFRHEEGRWIQEYGRKDRSIEFRRLDASGADAKEVRLMGNKFFTEIAGDFNLAEGPLVQAALFDRGPGQAGVLFLSVHHLVADGASIPMLLVEMQNRYRNRSVSEPELSYADWASRLDALAQSDVIKRDLDYWRDMCRRDSFDNLSLDDSPSETTSVTRLTELESRRLLDRFVTSRDQHDFFLSALARGWRQVTDHPQLFVNLETHGRLPLHGDAPVRTIGWCAAQYPLRVDEQDSSEVRRAIDLVPNYGLSFGLLKYLCRDQKISGTMNALPIPRISMAYRARWDDDFRSDSQFPVIARFVLDETYRRPESRTALTLYAGVENRSVWFYMTYLSRAFNRETIDRIGSLIRSDLLSI